MNRLRHVLQYLTMVGVPLIGLLGILRLGKNLAAPMAVRGTYRMLLVEGAVTPCLAPLFADSLLVITQSGAHLDIRFGNHLVRLDGLVDGNRVAARGVLPSTDRCPTADSVRLVGAATRGEHEVVLDARLDSVAIRGTRPRRPRR